VTLQELETRTKHLEEVLALRFSGLPADQETGSVVYSDTDDLNDVHAVLEEAASKTASGVIQLLDSWLPDALEDPVQKPPFQASPEQPQSLDLGAAVGAPRLTSPVQSYGVEVVPKKELPEDHQVSIMSAATGDHQISTMSEASGDHQVSIMSAAAGTAEG